MALANRRPVAFPVAESTSSSPSYKPRRLSLNSDYSMANATKKPATIKEMTPEGSSGSSPEDLEASPTSTVSTAVTSMSIGQNSTPKITKDKIKGEKKIKDKSSTKQPSATGISTTIPVTGERPKPEEHKSLDDTVLFNIFEILYDHDAEGKGMTVKQICDILVERHPDVANLSSKTSNLVSAKLNAYVKRIEKGEKSLIYSLSREWADASPKRMVYVYRGLLAPDFYLHALAAIETQKAEMQNASPTPEDNKNFFDSLKDGKNSGVFGLQGEMKRRATAFDLGINKNTFSDAQLDLTLPQITIPYAAAPVTASLGITASLKSTTAVAPAQTESSKDNAISDYDLEDLDQFDQADDLDEVKVTMRNNKRSKSMSYLQSKKMRTLTVAAAAPRLSKIMNNSPNAAAATAALHAAAFEGISRSGSFSLRRDSVSSEAPVAAKWLKAVKEGFLTQDIGTPESVNWEEIDSIFA
ncbi:CYFA0S10e03048g1_1 [Cyberlindnera fabianii]|uniref:CYFA0S10e03048g1_1 n=1 Tax=Cyberlindnera fabianii TaxID=36022 RepID=A0A061B7H6_CYBFA|nr:Protein GDS1 [Cyberlindnera fabianii]CDR42852.1 CYFA0S10e03048g1_1 [Cyberlindnera fabianii]